MAHWIFGWVFMTAHESTGNSWLVIKNENNFLTWLSLILKQVKNGTTILKSFLQMNVLKISNKKQCLTLIFLSEWKDIRDSDNFWHWKLTLKTRFSYFLTTQFSEIQIEEKRILEDIFDQNLLPIDLQNFTTEVMQLL